MRRGGEGRGPEGAAEAHALIRDHRILGQQGGERLRESLAGRLTFRQLRPRHLRDRGGGDAERVGKAGQRIGQVLLQPRQHVDRGLGRMQVAGLVRIGEERDRRTRADQHQVLDPAERLGRLIDRIGHARHRRPAAAAGDAAVGALRHQPGAGGGGDALRVGERRRVERPAAEQDQHALRRVRAQQPRDIADCGGIGLRRFRHRQRGRHRSALVPAGVGGQDQRGDRARGGARRLHRHRRVLPDRRRLGRGAHPAGDAARPALGVGGERRVVRAMVGRLVADAVHHLRVRAPPIVQVGKPVREARAAMQQRGRGLPRHPRIAVGRAGDHALEQAEHAAHAGDAVERGDEVHLAGAGIGEAGIDARGEQALHQAFRTVHPRAPHFAAAHCPRRRRLAMRLSRRGPGRTRRRGGHAPTSGCRSRSSP